LEVCVRRKLALLFILYLSRCGKRSSHRGENDLKITQKKLDKKMAKHAKWLEEKYRLGVRLGKRADFSGLDLRNTMLAGADLRRAIFVNADLRGATLRRALLDEADFTKANLRGANLEHADLPNANLSGANLVGANLRNADLLGANLTNAELQDSELDGAKITDRSFTSRLQPAATTSQQQSPVSSTTPSSQRERSASVAERDMRQQIAARLAQTALPQMARANDTSVANPQAAALYPDLTTIAPLAQTIQSASTALPSTPPGRRERSASVAQPDIRQQISARLAQTSPAQTTRANDTSVANPQAAALYPDLTTVAQVAPPVGEPQINDITPANISLRTPSAPPLADPFLNLDPYQELAAAIPAQPSAPPMDANVQAPSPPLVHLDSPELASERDQIHQWFEKMEPADAQNVLRELAEWSQDWNGSTEFVARAGVLASEMNWSLPTAYLACEMLELRADAQPTLQPSRSSPQRSRGLDFGL
jgi:uncharacterized protein YjbI with pentapeptide repeats